MSKKCAKCEKTVYPTEELKCLDKIWHKGCFKCQVCNMTLNMKNYKGYDKMPYCNAHYPQTKHTQVADTPEMRRIADNTVIQSNVQYHSQFERDKGTYTQVTDTPDMQRNLQNTKNVSLVEYQSDFLKSKGTITTIADPLMLKHHLENSKKFSLIDYQSDFEKLKGYSCQLPDTVEMQRHRKNIENFSLIKYHQEFEKQKGKKISVDDDPEMARVKQHMKTVSNVAYHGTLEQKQHMEENRPSQEGDAQQFRRRNPGKISEYDPPVQSGGTPYSQRTSQTNVVYDSEIGKAPSYKAPPQQYQPPPQQYQPPPQQYQPPPQQQYQPPPQQQYQPPPPQAPVDRQSKGMVCKAMYDYTAADDDEVSFQDGDEIIFCQPVDAGWMMGTVQRTGQRGMLPSNYVEQIK